MLVDSHCHLDFPDFADDLDAIVQGQLTPVSGASSPSRRGCGVSRDCSISPNEIPERLLLVAPIRTTADEEDGIVSGELIELTKHPKVVALGEAGLDYFYQHGLAPGAGAGFSRPHCGCPRDKNNPAPPRPVPRPSDVWSTRSVSPETMPSSSSALCGWVPTEQ